MKQTGIIPTEIIENKIFLIRGVKVMLDSDLATLYGVTTKRLNEQVKRNLKRFPSDFMFQLKEQEVKNLNRSQFATGSQNLKSQIATSSHGGRRTLPYAFTEHGVTMLASVLNSEKAVEIGIYVVRAFVRLREMLATHSKLLKEFEKFKKVQKVHGQHILNILNVISHLLNPPQPASPKEPLGFRDRDSDKKKQKGAG